MDTNVSFVLDLPLKYISKSTMSSEFGNGWHGFRYDRFIEAVSCLWEAEVEVFKHGNVAVLGHKNGVQAGV